MEMLPTFLWFTLCTLLGSLPTAAPSAAELMVKLQDMERFILSQSDTIERLVNQVQGLESRELHRRMQATTGDNGVDMRIHKRKMTSRTFNDTGGKLLSDGTHRRSQETCSSTDLTVGLSTLQAECCNEPGEDCRKTGFPISCNEACGSVVLTFWRDCRTLFVATSGPKVERQFQGLVDMCKNSATVAQKLPLAQEFSLTCSDPAYHSKPSLCIPECNTKLHGHVLLATIDGDDSSFACETHNGLYSWVGKASSGGYMGEDFRAFLSSIMTAAGGVFFLLSTETNANVGFDLTIEPWQKATIRADPAVSKASWGEGGFSVRELGQLSLADINVGGPFDVTAGAELILTNVTLNGTVKGMVCRIADFV